MQQAIVGQLKFGEPVEHKGQTAIVVGVRGSLNAVVVDLLKVREVRNGADLVQNVIGTARQVELVHFEHDVPAEEIERAEDWFFTLNEDDLDALMHERDRRIVVARLSKQSEEQKALSAALLQDVKIRPSDRVLQIAEKLWKDAVRTEQHAGEHDEIELPSYESKPELWKPWIEKAKNFVSQEKTQVFTVFQKEVEKGRGFGLPSAKERDQAEQAKVPDPNENLKGVERVASTQLQQDLKQSGAAEEGNSNIVDVPKVDEPGQGGTGSVN